MKTTKTVLIAQRPGDMLDVMAQWLRDAGYRVHVCGGPNEMRYNCWAHTLSDCPFWHTADLVIYDPWLATGYGGHDHFQIERERHANVPVLIWGPSAIPADVADLAESGAIEVLPADISREVLLEAVSRHIGGPALHLLPVLSR